MIVLGLDPGTTESAIVGWDGAHITEASIIPNDYMCLHLENNARGDVLVIEQVACMGKAAVGDTIHETSRWAGRFEQVWRTSQMLAEDTSRFKRIKRYAVKMHICGSMGANDAKIRAALIDRFGPPGNKKAKGITYGLKHDLWQAFALAVTAWDDLNKVQT